MDDPGTQEEIRKRLKAFYGVLKTADQWLRFVLLTGVTKFSQVSVFSDLNQLRDISMMKEYAELCGITLPELKHNFEPELKSLAEENSMTYDEAVAKMQKWYDGYHFSEMSAGVFNPFSVLNALGDRKFSNYWFKTGTPTFLVKQLGQIEFDLRKFSGDITIPASAIHDYRVDGNDPTPILYQSGYLTIKGYDPQFNEYVLGFPNEEVKYGFLEELVPIYVPASRGNNDFYVANFVRNLQKGDMEAFMTRLIAFFESIPYELNDKTERHYQSIFYLLFTLMGQFVQAEVRSTKGRADAVVTLQDTIYVFEFKLSGKSADTGVDAALRQIDEKGYLIPYSASGRKLVKVGVQFDPAKRNIGLWRATN
jgi:hypothetical protein